MDCNESVINKTLSPLVIHQYKPPPTSVTNIDVAKILLILTKMAGFNYFIIEF